MRKIILLAACFMPFTLFGQGLIISEGASMHINSATIHAKLTVNNEGDLTNNNGTLSLSKDFSSVGNYQSTGKEKFIGKDTQRISGLFADDNLLNDVTIQKDKQTILYLENDVAVRNKLTIESGLVQTQEFKISLQNTDPSALVSEVTSGEHDAFIIGYFERNLLANKSYIFPVGDQKTGAQLIEIVPQASNESELAATLHFSTSNNLDNKQIAACDNEYHYLFGNWSLTSTNQLLKGTVRLKPAFSSELLSSKSIVGLYTDEKMYTNNCKGYKSNYELDDKLLVSDYALFSTDPVLAKIKLINPTITFTAAMAAYFAQFYYRLQSRMQAKPVD